MSNKRSHHAFSGVSSELIALAGTRIMRGALNSCERYSVDLNKWGKLPNLNTSRISPGSVVLRSMRAFCFCGANYYRKQFNSIESIQLNESKLKWRTLPLNEKIAQISKVMAVDVGTGIYVFGGRKYGYMYKLNEEGELVADLSDSRLIPFKKERYEAVHVHYETQINMVVHSGSIYAIELYDGSYRVKKFDWREWSLLYS